MIEYDLCGPEDIDETCDMLSQVFSQGDPPAVAVGLTAPEFRAFVQLLSSRMADERLTIVARLADSGELVGALLSEDAASPLPEGVEHLSPKFDPIFDILGQLDEEYRGDSEVAQGERLHVFLLGVSPRARGLGVAQELVRQCLDNGSRLGYQLAFTEATNKASQHVFRKAGFVKRVARSYETHKVHGEAVFASIADQGGPMLMDRLLKL